MFRKNKKTKKELKKKELSSQEKIKRIKKIAFLILLIVFIGIIFWIIFFSSFIKIKDINIEGFQEDVAMEIVSSVVNSKYLGLIPQDNIFLLSSSQIRNNLQKRIILAQDVRVKKVFPNSVNVFYSERKGVITWCSEEDRGNCFLIDENGEAFYQLESNVEPIEKDFPVIFDKGGLEIEIGKTAIKPELAKFCFEISDFVLKETNLKLNSGDYYTPSFMSGEIRAETEQGWIIHFNSFSNAYKQSILLKTVIEEDIKQENLSKLEYIDLRLDGKVLYKLKEADVNEKEESGDDNKDNNDE